MPDLSPILWIALGLLAWLLVAVGLVLMVVVLPRWQRSDARVEARARAERRAGDRRIGLPDPREVQVERRSGVDRRRGPAAMA